MSSTVEDISSTKKRLTIEIPTDVIENEYKTSLEKMRQSAKIPGFRQGKVPANIIEKKFGKEIKADIIDRLVPDYYTKTLKEAELVPVTFPQFESELNIKRNAPLSFSLTVEVRPPLHDLTYTDLHVENIPVEVETKDIEETLQGLQQDRAIFHVAEREIKEDDLIVIDYAKLDETGAHELSSGKDQVMHLGNRVTPPAILEALIGKKKGDVVEIELPPSESGDTQTEAERVTDRGGHVRISIKEVKEKELPEIDDEFAKDFGHDSLESLREKIRDGLFSAKKESAAKQQKAKLLEKLVQSHDFDVPESLLEKELENLVVNEKLSQKQSRELIKEAHDPKSSEGSDDAALREKLRPKAIDNVKATVLLDMIAEKERISVDENELKARILSLAQHLKTTPEAVMNLFMTKDGSLENLRNSVRDEKVLDLILSKAEIIKGD